MNKIRYPYLIKKQILKIVVQIAMMKNNWIPLVRKVNN